MDTQRLKPQASGLNRSSLGPLCILISVSLVFLCDHEWWEQVYLTILTALGIAFLLLVGLV